MYLVNEKKCSETCLKIGKLFFKNLQIFLENLSDIVLKNGQVLSEKIRESPGRTLSYLKNQKYLHIFLTVGNFW